MGRVYKARELGLERVVALKCLHLTLISDADSRQRFEREGKVLATLRHPNILTFYRFGIWQSQIPYIAMEFIEGRSLRQVIDEEGRIDSERTLTIGRQICDGLGEAHKQNIVHRDLKPTNIMLAANEDESRSVRILDFGLARILEPDDAQRSQSLTQTGELIGSVYYMSPEQCRGQRADHRSDIYSLGCLLYECIAGTRPFEADNPVGLMHLHLNQEPSDLPKAAALGGLNNVILKALQKDPNSRYQTMNEMKADLDLVLQGSGDKIAVVRTKAMSTKAKGISIAAMLTGILVLAAGMFWLTRTLNHQPDSTPIQTRLGNFAKRGSLTSLGPRLPERKQLYAQIPSTTERIAALKNWLARYGNRDAIETANAYFHLYFDLRTVNALESECTQAANNALTRFKKIMSEAKPNPDEPPPLEVQDAVFRSCEIYRDMNDSTRSSEFLLRLMNNWKMPDSKRYWNVHEALALAAASRGDYKEQEYWYKEYLKKGSYSRIDASVVYACFLLERKRQSESEKVLDAAIKATEDDATYSATLKFAKALSYQHRYKMAWRYAEVVEKESPLLGADGTIAEIKASCLIAEGRYSEAQPYLMEKWKCEVGPDKWHTFLEVVQNAQRAKTNLDTRALLDKQLATAGGTADALYGLHLVLERTNKEDRALQDMVISSFRKIFSSLNQTEAQGCTERYSLFANTALDKGRFAEGEAMIRDLICRTNSLPAGLRERIELQNLMGVALCARYTKSPDATEKMEAAYAYCMLHPQLDKRSTVKVIAFEADTLWSKKQFAQAREVLAKALPLSDQLRIPEKRSLFSTYAQYCKVTGRIDEGKIWGARAEALQ